MSHAFKSALVWVRQRMPFGESKKSRLAIRIAKWTTGIVGGIWLLYVLTANIALQTRWARNVANASPQTLQVDYASAWTAIPGIIHLSKVTCFGQFTGIEYRAEVEHVRVNLVMLQLLRSHIVLHVSVEGVGLRAKDPKSVNPAAPVIDAPIALRPLEAPPVPVVDESLSKWTIQVELEVTQGREAWVEALHYQGPIDVSASMTTTPNRSFAIKDLLIGIDGNVIVGAKPAVPRLCGAIDVKLDPVDPRAVDLGAFRRLTVATKIEATLADLSFVEDVTPLPVKLRGEGGDIGIQVTVEHGQLMAPGQAKILTGKIALGVDQMNTTLQLDADALLEGAAEGPIARVAAHAVRTDITNAKGVVILTAPLAATHGVAMDLDLANATKMRLTFDAQVPHAAIPDAVSFNALVASPSVHIVKGRIDASAKVIGEVPKGSFAGDLTFNSDPIRVIVEGVTAQGKLAGNVPFERANSDADIVLSKTYVHIDDTSLDNGPSHTKNWWGHASLPKGKLRLKGDPLYIGSIHSEFRDIDPVVTAISKLHGVPEWTNKLLGIGPYTVDAIGVFGKRTKVDLVDARATATGLPNHPRTRVRATYDGTKNTEPWRTAIELGAASVGIEGSTKGASVQLTDVSAWFDGQNQAVR